VEYTAGGSWNSFDPGFSGPEGITVDQSGNIWVADTLNSRIVELLAASSYSQAVLSDANDSGPQQLGRPDAIAANLNSGGSDDIWVADKQNNAIYKYSISGQSWTQFTNGLSVPAAIAVDSNSNVWVGDWGNNQVQEYTAGGTWLPTPLTDGSDLVNPSGLAIDSSNNIFVTCSNGDVLEYSGTWQVISSGFFNNPKGLMLISSAMYVADDGSGSTNDIYKLCY
jgi:tripartite motif-containing protein 71